jgi:hypothetical protein
MPPSRLIRKAGLKPLLQTRICQQYCITSPEPSPPPGMCVQEDDYPGVADIRDEIARTFDQTRLSSIPHAQVLSDIHEVGKTFRILLIKTNSTIPYTSVYMRLDCGYMTDEVDHQIRNSVASATR